MSLSIMLSCSSTGGVVGKVTKPMTNFFTTNLWVNSFNRVVFGYPDYPLSREMIEGIPYASMRIKIGKGPAGLMILQEKEKDIYAWVSKDSVLIKTKNGRIIRTSKLNNDLLDYYFHDDLDFQKVASGETSKIRTQKDFSFRDIIRGNVPIREIIAFEEEKFFYSTRLISLNNPPVRGLDIQVYTKVEGEEIIKILEREYKVLLIKEIVQNKKIKWRHENLFWVNPNTGFVWKSLQQIAPNVPAISLEITKAPNI